MTNLDDLAFAGTDEDLELPNDLGPLVDTKRIAWLGRELLKAIGEDPDREGLLDTPDRWARWWTEFAAYDPGVMDRTFDGVQVDQLVVLRDVNVWTLCEHHLLPFSVRVSMGYLTGTRVLGLSKLARMAHAAAHRLQVQERLVQDIATMIGQAAETEDVAVIATGKHLCMSMRGIRTDGEMVTSSLGGRFKQAELRGEFLALSGY